jgi:UDP-N-acetylmuramate dehydrogenase
VRGFEAVEIQGADLADGTAPIIRSEAQIKLYNWVQMLFRLLAIPNLHVFVNPSLARYTRFEIGGPARVLLDAGDENALFETWRAVEDSRWPPTVIGGGTNLIVDDEGFPGAVLRYTAGAIAIEEQTVRVEAGAVLQDLVDRTIACGLRGLETMTGIPGWTGGAIYGNAGAYGHSIHERVVSVRYFDGKSIGELDNAQCEFRYRESVFKRCKDWIILSATLRLDRADAAELRSISEGILKIRNEKYPPTMRCAGSIFKNLLFDEIPVEARAGVPARVIREGKVPSAYFLEQAGAKGLSRGAIHVADYHANLIYNSGGGSARELREMIRGLKARVREMFGIELEEEVQFVGVL